MKKRVVLIGGFRKAYFLALSLINQGCSVSVVNNDMKKCKILSEIDGLDVYYGDGSRPFTLEDANVYNADIAIALTDKDEVDLVICELCKKRFKVKKTIAIVSDPGKKDFFHKMGVDAVVCDIFIISSLIEQEIMLDEITKLVPVGEENVRISQVHILDTSNSASKELRELALPKNSIIGCVSRGDKHIIPHGNTKIMAGDVLLLIASDEEDEAVAVKELTH